MQPGPGWGGSCFPKDSVELVQSSSEFGVELATLKAAIISNDHHKKWGVDQAINLLKKFNVQDVALLGLAFKADTDDVRESSAIDFWNGFTEAKLTVYATDERASINFKKVLGRNIQTFTLDHAIENARAVIINTEWPRYRSVDWQKLIKTKQLECVIDFRSITQGINSERIYRLC